MESPVKKKGDFSKALSLMGGLPKGISYEQFCRVLEARWKAAEQKAIAEERGKSS